MKPIQWLSAVHRTSTVSVAARSVAASLACRSDTNGTCYPSRAVVEDDTGLSRSTVQRGIRELRDAGWIVSTERVRPHGSTSNRYLLINPCGKTLDNNSTGVTQTPPGVTQTPPGGGHTDPQKETDQRRRHDTTAHNPQAVVDLITWGARSVRLPE